MSGGITLYFDRLILQPKVINQLKFHCFSVPGAKRFLPLRKKVGNGMDGVIFIVDSQRIRFQYNIDSFYELKRFVKEHFKQKIPLALVLNKNDLEDTITQNEWMDYFVENETPLEGLDSPFALNSLIYSTHLYEKNIIRNFQGNYDMFSQISRRILAYTIHRPKNISDEHSFAYETFYENDSGFKLTDSTALDHLVKSLKIEREEREEDRRKKEEEIKENLRKNEEEIKEKRKKKALLQKIKQILSVSTK